MLDAGRDQLGLEPGDVVLAVARPSDEGALAELLLPLTQGAQLVLDEDDLLGDPPRLAQRISETRATLVLCPPDTWGGLLPESWGGSPALAALCVGGTLDPTVASALLLRVGTLWTAFGGAEAGPWAALTRIESADQANRLSPPLPGVSLASVDPDLRPVPSGIVGELLIGGRVVARELSPSPGSGRFVDLGASERVHRSGHRVRARGDGSYDLLPRLDQRRTIRGARVEIGEIESALAQSPDVGEAAVLLSKDSKGALQLVAYVTGRDGRAPSAADLRRHLRRHLPGRLIPASFVLLDDAVRQPDGRIDRRALPELQAVRERANRVRTLPRTPLETAIAEVWQEVLEIGAVGVDDNFFNLGGHSLLATIVAHRIQQKTGRRPGLRALMFQTLEQLARGLEAGPG
jgi:acyl-CoA synthetase (AMP-forming)/AMP-acid ligase II